MEPSRFRDGAIRGGGASRRDRPALRHGAYAPWLHSALKTRVNALTAGYKLYTEFAL
jgi:hypothetical protein